MEEIAVEMPNEFSNPIDNVSSAESDAEDVHVTFPYPRIIFKLKNKKYKYHPIYLPNNSIKVEMQDQLIIDPISISPNLLILIYFSMAL